MERKEVGSRLLCPSVLRGIIAPPSPPHAGEVRQVDVLELLEVHRNGLTGCSAQTLYFYKHWVSADRVSCRPLDEQFELAISAGLDTQ
ncbi:MAG: hypothetical protein U9Q81_20345 [Pseudomonadota bacterium]|nr:hypothetical protein [Pseudomonadota bacterium]